MSTKTSGSKKTELHLHVYVKILKSTVINKNSNFFTYYFQLINL